MNRTILNLTLGLFSLVVFAGCKDEEPLDLTIPRLMIETRGVSYGGLVGETVELPVSGTRISIQKDPLVTEFDIVNAEMVQVELGMALLIQLSEKGARQLYRGSVTNMGGRVVLTINGNAVGARRIDAAIQDGNFYTFVEIDDEELGELVLDIKESLVNIREQENQSSYW